MLSLLASLAGAAMFLPPLLESTLGSALRTAAAGALVGCSLLLHWIFLGLAVRRRQRSVPGWVGFSVLLYPIGSATALMLLQARPQEFAGVAPHAPRAPSVASR